MWSYFEFHWLMVNSSIFSCVYLLFHFLHKSEVPVQIFWFFLFLVFFLLVHRNYVYFCISPLCCKYLTPLYHFTLLKLVLFLCGFFFCGFCFFIFCGVLFVFVFCKTEIPKVLAKHNFYIIEVNSVYFYGLYFMWFFKSLSTIKV